MPDLYRDIAAEAAEKLAAASDFGSSGLWIRISIRRKYRRRVLQNMNTEAGHGDPRQGKFLRRNAVVGLCRRSRCSRVAPIASSHSSYPAEADANAEPDDPGGLAASPSRRSSPRACWIPRRSCARIPSRAHRGHELLLRGLWRGRTTNLPPARSQFYLRDQAGERLRCIRCNIRLDLSRGPCL